MTRTVALISDIHGNLPALRALAPALEEADAVLCLGDLVGYYPWPNEIVKTARSGEWLCVRGNHERALATRNYSDFGEKAQTSLRWTENALSPENLDWLTTLPDERDVEINNVTVHLVHGSPGDPDRYVMPDTLDIALRGMLENGGGDVLALGHTHRPMLKEFKTGAVMNPGSAGQPRDGDPRASLAMMNISEEGTVFEFVRTPCDVDEVKKAVECEGLPSRLWERLLAGR